MVDKGRCRFYFFPFYATSSEYQKRIEFFILLHRKTRLTISIEYNTKIPTYKKRRPVSIKNHEDTAPHHTYNTQKRNNKPTHTCINVSIFHPTILYPLDNFLCCLCSIFVSTKRLGTFSTSTNSFTFNIFPAI